VEEMDTQPGFCFSLLGNWCAYFGEWQIAESSLKSRKALNLFKLLALTPKHRIHRDQAMDAFWPDLDAVSAASQLYKAVHYIRKALEKADPPVPADSLLSFNNEVLALAAPGGVHTDAEAFQAIAHEAHRTNLLSTYQRAVACYAGDLLPDDLYEAWTEETRESLRLQFMQLLLETGQKNLEAENLAEAAEVFRRALSLDPLEEAGHRGIMRTFALQGNREQALHQYKRCSEILAAELNVKPAPETTRLYQDIRENLIQPLKKRPAKSNASKATMLFPKGNALIGRKQEMQIIAARLDDLEQGKGSALLIEGMAGIGKTRLAQEILLLAQRRDYRAMIGAAADHEKELPYTPFVEALRMTIQISHEFTSLIPDELAAVIPEISVPAPLRAGQTQLSAQSSLFAGVYRYLKAISEKMPSVLILDDLQNADDGTLKLFHYLARQSAELQLLLVGIYRSLTGADSANLASLIANLERAYSVKRLVLTPLPPEEAQKLLLQVLRKGKVDETFAHQVYSLTEGNPLFTLEMAQQLSNSGDVVYQGGVWRASPTNQFYLPPSLRTLLAQKWNRLSSKAQHLLNVAATAGQSVHYSLLENVLEIHGEPFLELLEETMIVGLLQESGLMYSFVHPLFYEAVYQQMSQARQRELHKRIGFALEGQFAENPAKPIEALAYHFSQGQFPQKALPYLMQAGERAAALYAHESAISYYTQALAFDDGQCAADLHEKVGDLYGFLGKEKESTEHYVAALSSRDSRSLRPLHRKAAYRFALAGNLDRSWQHLTSALELTDGVRDIEFAHLQYALAHYHFQRNDFAKALQVAQESLAVAKELGDDDAITQAYELMALCCVPLGEWRMGMDYEDQRIGRADVNRHLADISDIHL